jgi:hypothetical protein
MPTFTSSDQRLPAAVYNDMNQRQSVEPRLEAAALAALTALSMQVKQDMYILIDRRCGMMLLTRRSTLRNRFDSPLLRLPPEIRNKILEIAVWPTYDESARRRGWTRQLLWTRACKQLWAETQLLPFALCTFTFAAGDTHNFFIGKTSPEQRKVIKSLHLKLACSKEAAGRKIVWWACNRGESTARSIDTHFKPAFNGMQTLYPEIDCMDREEYEAAKGWIADVKEDNVAVVLIIKINRPLQVSRHA